MGVGRTNPASGLALKEQMSTEQLIPKNNLADLPDRAAALSNLGVTLTAAQINQLGLGFQRVPITITDGAAAGTFTPIAGCCVLQITTETPVAVPGTPTNTNLRLGSGANGEQYVADVDVKGAGGILLTLVAAARLAASTAADWHYTVASSGGTASAQDSTVYLNILYGRTS